MTVSKTTDYWTSRLDGNNPAQPVGMNNEAWVVDAQGPAGAADGLNWRINGSNTYGFWKVVPTTTEYTMWISFSFNTPPSSGATIAQLDNGTHEVLLKSNGDNTSLQLIGASGATTMITGLDLNMSEDNSIPTVIRLTLSSSGVAKAYVYDIMEDDDGNVLNKTIDGYNTNTGTKRAIWGNGSGDVTWYAVYFTSMGAFNPDEMVTSNYSNVTLIQTAFGIIDVLRTARSYNLKNVVQPSGILYGYDISSNVAVRQVPAVHVLIRRVDSPDMYSLAGTSAEYFFQVEVYVVTKGTDYKNAYRQGMAIIGECLDELYSKTGLKGSTDSLIGHDARLDSRLDPDDQICVHVLNLRYMRRVDLSRRASTT